MQRNRDWVLLSGNSHPQLAKNISEHLKRPLGNVEIRRFSDGEIFVEIKENVRGRSVYVIQSTCSPVNDSLMELLIMMDALKRASAKEINVITPYYGYSRQDRKVSPRTPISAKLTADLLTAAGATRVVAVDLHAGQIQGFFNIPFDNLYAMPVLHEYLATSLKKQSIAEEEVVVVSPDAGGMMRSRSLAKRMNNASVALIDKRRTGPNVAMAMNIVGEVEGKIAIILDDMIDTAGTLTEAANAVMKNGAKKVIAVASHGVFSGEAVKRIESSNIERVIVTDSIPLSAEAQKCKKIEQISIAPLLGEAIYRIHHYDSVSSLFT